MITPAEADAAADVLARGGLILFGADTVYGLACAADRPDAVERLLTLKGRSADKPNAVLAFSVEAAASVLGELGPYTSAAAAALLPGPATLVLPGGIGLRVPQLVPGAAALTRIPTLVVQSSANRAGQAPPSSLADVDPQIRGAVDVALDAGELPGLASTVVDLSHYETDREWRILRDGAVGAAEIARTLNPGTKCSP